MNQESKQCQNCKEKFRIEPEDFAFYEKMQVPPPTFCPECRLVRRLIHYNKRTLHKRTCQLCGKSTFSMYTPSNPISVYCNTCWWSDKWDPMDYGIGYDPARPFFAQVKELLDKTPWMALGVNQPTLVNSEYCNAAGGLKNCYLVFYADFAENSYYCDTVVNIKDCFDCFLTGYSENCFECVNVTKCYRAYFSTDCDNSFDIYFSKNLVGCSDCFGCVNLRNKQYYIFNKQYSKEEYIEKLKNFDLSTNEGIRNVWQEAEKLFVTFPHKYIHGHHNVNTTGDYVEHTNNSRDCFLVENVEDSKYLFIMYMRPTKDCYDYCFYGDNASQVYESIKSGGDINNIKFCNGCFPGGRNLTYCHYCINSSNLFGCVGLRKKEYCILNKQYSKEEYEKLIPKIIEDMKKNTYIDSREHVYSYGEFYPAEFSPFAYNEAITQEFFPLTQIQAKEKRLKWLETEEKKYQITKDSADLPKSIEDADDSILSEVIGCEHKGSCSHQCSMAFRIIPQELSLYRKMNFALPHLCPNCRHYERLKRSNPIKLYQRRCNCAGLMSENGIYTNVGQHFHEKAKCPNEFETSYPPRPTRLDSAKRASERVEAGAPERKEIVYCETCYQNEVA